MSSEYEEVFCLLKYAIGLDPSAMGRDSLRSLVKGQMRRQGIADAGDYAAILSSSPKQLQALIETVVVSESWFFREPRALERLTQLALAAPPSRVFRVLCLPCAAGEEAYSIAIALLEAGVENFKVHAYDLSQDALVKARAGLYSLYAFRGRRPESMAAYLRPVADQYQVLPRISERIHFDQANIMEGLPASAQAESYDAVFCRNLLIYLTPEARRDALAAFRRQLSEQGELFVAVCEAASIAPEHFQASAPYFAFAPLNRSASRLATPLKRRSQRTLFPLKSLPLIGSGSKTTPQRLLPTQSPLPETPGMEELLTLARLRADAGELLEAGRMCEIALENEPTSAGYLLLGVIKSAQGAHDSARKFLRRALYLDPRNREALLHMAAYAERDGRQDIGQDLRSRAARADRLR